MAMKGKSAREMQAEVEAALRQRQKQLGRGGLRRLAVFAILVAVALALLAFAVWLGLFALHLGAGATADDALEMTFDDARVAARCPQKVGELADFLTRGATVPLSSLPNAAEARAQICDGRYDELAPGLSPP
jgi:hypothetical protein